MVDLRPSDHTRLEVAFAAMPDDVNPVWTDLTSRLDLKRGWSRTYGAGDEFATVQPSTATVAVDNRDGALTAGSVSSAFYPNVRPQRKFRLSYRDPSVDGNLLSAENASFEGGTVGGWAGSGGAAVANDTAHADVGTKALRITWPTGGVPWAQLLFTGLVVGRTYTFQSRVWSATGVPDVRVGIFGIANGTATSTKNAFATVSVTFVATNSQHLVLVSCATATTAGQQTWVDANLVDEGSSVRTFTTSAPPITYLFTGHVEEWPTEWPGGQLYSQATITATDRLARIGAKRAMRSVIEEAVLADSPKAYYPLGEPEGSVLGGDIAGQMAGSLSIAAAGAGGGTLLFGTATGPPTDGLPAPQFAPVSLTNGKYLTSSIPPVGIGFPAGVAAAFLTSSATAQVVAQVREEFGSTMGLSIETGTGKLVGSMYVPWFGTQFTITSAASVADGNTHYGEVLINGATATMWLDGALVGTAALSGYPTFKYLDVGGTRTGALFTGTISHVAVFASATSQTLAKHQVRNTAATTGFAGERSDQRIARYAAWAGVPSADMNLDVGSSTSIAFTETTGQSILQAMQDVAQTEGGRLFVNGAGVLTFHARSRRYANPAAVASVSARMLSGSEKFTLSTQGLVNDLTGSRPDGPQIRAFDAASIAEFGVFNSSLTLLATADSEVADAINWRVSTNAQPEVRLPQGTFDLYTDATTGAALRAVELGDRVSITNLPSQAPSSTMDFVVEGYTENVSVSGWTRTANLSNYSDVQGFTLDDNVYGLLDSDNRLVY